MSLVGATEDLLQASLLRPYPLIGSCRNDSSTSTCGGIFAIGTNGRTEDKLFTLAAEGAHSPAACSGVKQIISMTTSKRAAANCRSKSANWLRSPVSCFTAPGGNTSAGAIENSNLGAPRQQVLDDPPLHQPGSTDDKTGIA